jgi:hypothetical protein
VGPVLDLFTGAAAALHVGGLGGRGDQPIGFTLTNQQWCGDVTGGDVLAEAITERAGGRGAGPDGRNALEYSPSLALPRRKPEAWRCSVD